VTGRDRREYTVFYNPPAYEDWKRDVHKMLLQLHLPVLRIPCALTLHMRLTPRGGHKPDVDNLAGGFMDAANGVLYQDDAQTALLGAYKARNPANAVTIDNIPLDEAHIPELRAAWNALLEACIADIRAGLHTSIPKPRTAKPRARKRA